MHLLEGLNAGQLFPLIYYIGGAFFLGVVLWLFPRRRNFRFWRKLNGETWYTRVYIGENTSFPTRRRYNRRVWLREHELGRECYLKTDHARVEHGRLEKRIERAAAARLAERARAAERAQQQRDVDESAKPPVTVSLAKPGHDDSAVAPQPSAEARPVEVEHVPVPAESDERPRLSRVA